MGILRIVRMDFDPSKVEEFDEMFVRFETRIVAQEGCRKVLLLKSTENPTERTTISWWEDEASLHAYRSSSLFGEVWPLTKSKFQSDPIAWTLEWDEDYTSL